MSDCYSFSELKTNSLSSLVLEFYRSRVLEFDSLEYSYGGFFWIFCYIFVYVQHFFICRPSDSTVSEDAGIECRNVRTLALTARRFKHWARSHKQS